jgi:PGF-CTERM protein
VGVNRERTLAAAAVAVLVVAAIAAVAVPGALARKAAEDEESPPSSLTLREPRVSAGEVSGETAEVSLDVRFDHDGGPAENVTVEVQAIDEDTNLVETTARKSLGTIEGEREVRTRLNVSVEREGGYRFDIRLYENGERVTTGSTTVRGVGSLTPAYERTGVTFQGFESTSADLPSVTFSIGATANNRTTLETRTFLTNGGDETADRIELAVRARQVDSNIVADRARIDVGSIDPGATVTPEATLDVPDEYNYHLDAILLKDGVVVETASAPATLDPSLPTAGNETTNDDDGLETGDFQQDAESADGSPDEPDRPPETETSASSGPGFGAPVALVALVAAALLARRARREP